ncbi:hypothetical protein [Ginsengibacter hankyongi]|uniref:hypothetical protein n=1 Tax=Ginsengibacter hankyongi TaxID=2607284 RepID=UPI001926BE5E|nr:hypothetical protein [Ginsengibacter hankyongi]
MYQFSCLVSQYYSGSILVSVWHVGGSVPYVHASVCGWVRSASCLPWFVAALL